MVKLFVAYSRKDKILKDEMIAHFEPFRLKWNMEIWHDGEIKPGEHWDNSIKEKIQEADIIVPLISPDFFVSKYILEVEMAEALRRHSNNECIVIPVILRSYAWYEVPSLTLLQVLPTDARPVMAWRDRDEAWLNVFSGVAKVLENIKIERIRKARIQTLEEKVSKLESENERLKEELEKTAEQRERFGELESKLEEAKTSSQSLIVSLKEKVEVLEAENKKLRESLQKSEERERRYTHLELKWNGIEQENRNLAARINQLEAENNAILREKEDLKKEKQKDKGYADLAEKQQAELSQKLKAATDENNRLKKEVANIKSQVARCYEMLKNHNTIVIWLVLFFGVIGLPFTIVLLSLVYLLEYFFKSRSGIEILISGIVSLLAVIALNYYFYVTESYLLNYAIISAVSFLFGLLTICLLVYEKEEIDKIVQPLSKI